MPDLKAAGAVCYAVEGDKVLFLLLRSAKHGEWGAPKGHTQEHETEIETAVRELFEETGLRHVDFVPGFRQCIAYNVQKNGKVCSKEVAYFLCRVDPDEVRLSHEHTEAHLATIAEIEVLIPHEVMKAVFRKALEHMKP
ncbi:MAG: NUDIX domain-containing protein [Planctomycetota bacterium]|nr:NUDIX domain-containing protein [Planctomycetota bacterium]